MDVCLPISCFSVLCVLCGTIFCNFSSPAFQSLIKWWSLMSNFNLNWKLHMKTSLKLHMKTSLQLLMKTSRQVGKKNFSLDRKETYPCFTVIKRAQNFLANFSQHLNYSTRINWKFVGLNQLNCQWFAFTNIYVSNQKVASRHFFVQNS